MGLRVTNLALALSIMLISSDARSRPGANAPNEPTGASAAFTSSDPVIAQARELVAEGDFTRAEALLRGQVADAAASREMLDIIWRIRMAYSLSADDLLKKLREQVPDATADDLERWRKAGQVQFRLIDGRAAYFGREPANLLRFCDEARQRRRAAPTTQQAWKYHDHLARVAAAARDEHKEQVVPMRHRIRYILTIASDAPGMKAGTVVRVWLPFPQEYRQQGDVKLIRTGPPHKSIAPATAAQRTVYFEQRIIDPKSPLTFEETFEFTTSAYYPRLDDGKARPLPADWSGGNLAERPPHIVFTPKLGQTVAQVVGSETNSLIEARRIFEFVSKIAYCAEEEYSTIPSLSDKCLTSGRGDCGVHAMLFITMCRAAGVPARWQSGWQTERVGYDMHDWCEFYVEPWGWLPADPTYGFEKSEDPAVRDFNFGHLPAYRMIVNLDYGRELFPPRQSLRSEPLDFQRGEVEIDGKNLYYPYWDYDMQIEWLDEGP
jgi:transglutaminase-like putative cysteine protease